jgi:hypothetical protein
MLEFSCISCTSGRLPSDSQEYSKHAFPFDRFRSKTMLLVGGRGVGSSKWLHPVTALINALKANDTTT